MPPGLSGRHIISPKEIIFYLMSKDNILEFRGTVIEVLPNSMFRVQLDTNEHTLLAYSSGKIKQNKIKILTGDSVTVEVSAYDLNKGRVTYRH